MSHQVKLIEQVLNFDTSLPLTSIHSFNFMGGVKKKLVTKTWI
jgi:hypothetical protein